MVLGITFADAPSKPSRKEHKKKHKKEKKKKHSSRKEHSSKHEGAGSGSEDSGASSAEENAAADAAPAAQGGNGGVAREAWMTQPGLGRPHAAEAERIAAEAAEKEEAARLAAEKAKEPEIVVGLRIMKPGGGTPQPDTVSTGEAPSGGSGASGSAAKPPVVGDGGRSWRLKALKRAQEQAAASGGDVAAVVADRWGSLQNLTSGLTEGRAADSKAHLHASKQRERASGGIHAPAVAANSGKASSGRHYLSDLRSSDKPQMRKPSMDSSLSFRRRGSGSGREDSVTAPARSGSVGADSAEPDQDKQRGRAGSSLPVVDEGGPEDEHRSEAARAHAGDQGRHEHRHHSRDREHDRERDGDRHRDRDRDTRHRRDEDDRGDRKQSLSRFSRHEESEGRGRHHGGERSHPGRERDNNMSAEQVAALQGVASALNQHASDGSFMENFQKQQQGAKKQHAGAAKREKDQAMADEMREEMRRLRTGMGGGGFDDGGDEMDVDDAVSMQPGVAEEEIEAESDSQKPERGQRTRHRMEHDDDENYNVGPGRARKESLSHPPPAAGNKSMAEVLRARLKGLPEPELKPAAPVSRPAADQGRDATGNRDHDRDSVRHREDRHHGTHHGRHRDKERERDRSPAADGEGGNKKQVVALPLVDQSGWAVKGAFGREEASEAGRPAGRPAKRIQRYDEHGQKVRYFNDDDVDLETLVKRTKYHDDHDAALDRTVVNNITRKARFKESELDVDNEYDYDMGLELYEGKKRKGTAEQQASREKSRQVAAYQRQQRAEQQCMYCIGSECRPAHTTIAMAPTTYLMIPPRGRLVPGHCCIVPKDHTPSLRQVDDNVWTEIKNFIKCLIQMFGSQGKDVIFWETAVGLHGNKRHAILEAVPVNAREFAQAPGYFKKAMQEAESEWSTHAAKAVIETSAKKGLRESIPPNFAYLYVQFGYGHGYVHVIDDETKFDSQLGRQVLVGLLRLPPEEMHKRHTNENAATQQQWARDFVSMWAPYDWTLQL